MDDFEHGLDGGEQLLPVCFCLGVLQAGKVLDLADQVGDAELHGMANACSRVIMAQKLPEVFDQRIGKMKPSFKRHSSTAANLLASPPKEWTKLIGILTCSAIYAPIGLSGKKSWKDSRPRERLL